MDVGPTTGATSLKETDSTTPRSYRLLIAPQLRVEACVPLPPPQQNVDWLNLYKTHTVMATVSYWVWGPLMSLRHCFIWPSSASYNLSTPIPWWHLSFAVCDTHTCTYSCVCAQVCVPPLPSPSVQLPRRSLSTVLPILDDITPLCTVFWKLSNSIQRLCTSPISSIAPVLYISFLMSWNFFTSWCTSFYTLQILSPSLTCLHFKISQVYTFVCSMSSYSGTLALSAYFDVFSSLSIKRPSSLGSLLYSCQI